MVLDLGLPDLDGVEVIGGLRGWTAVPIVVLSGRAESRDKVDALDAGADDYVTKPFGVDELLARIRAALRRAQPAAEHPAVVTVGRYAVDLAARTVSHDVKLTPTEWQILDHLLRNPGMLVSQRLLLRDVWGGRSTRPRRTICGSTWPGCAASSRRIRRTRGTCSPSRAWATGSRPDRPARRRP
nr:hypothetical protein GCM10020092_068660 [Actinoplanes digitatis]